jgi:hypothetical protein
LPKYRDDDVEPRVKGFERRIASTRLAQHLTSFFATFDYLSVIAPLHIKPRNFNDLNLKHITTTIC